MSDKEYISDEEFLANLLNIDNEKLIQSLQNCGHDGYYNDLYYPIIEEIKRRLSLSPSAEPERIIKIGQRSGKTLESAIDYLHSVGWLQEHDRILTESAEPERRWIPVTEALPEECVSVLIQMDDGEMAVSQRRDMNYWDGYGRCGDVIAWMPLPEPWRGE